ncbi:NAD+ synthase [Thermoplasma sp.]|uniref:NAD+ synthase n=1 Tax=Thermoplasma sp. TaxID=1973142 RepID=UPI0025F0427A|nr:NAD+ synthase [Thermoplasma sp.]
MQEIERISNFLRKVLGGKNAVIGISGGIDSSVTLALLTRSIEKEKIIAVFMPDRNTPQADYDDVKQLTEKLGVTYRQVRIDPMVDSFVNTLAASDRAAIGNIKSRMRMIVLYYFANTNNGMVVGTTNRTELLLGYFTKYGDGGCDVEPIEHLYKRDIYELARILDIPESIIAKKPTAGLWEGQTDEGEIGMTYAQMDDILADIFDRGTFTDKLEYKKIMEMHSRSDHKRTLPYSLKK